MSSLLEAVSENIQEVLTTEVFQLERRLHILDFLKDLFNEKCFTGGAGFIHDS